ncbi:MAG: S8 family serine peptidase [Bacteroidota bacterium]
MTNRTTLGVCLLLLLTHLGYAQTDWTLDTDQLFYFNGTENVTLEAYPTAAAIYFEEVPLASELEVLRTDFPDYQLFAEKKLLIIERVSGFDELTSLAGRNNFLGQYELARANAFEVLPMFLLAGGYPAWFTDKVDIRLKKTVNLADLNPYLAAYNASIVRTIRNETYQIELTDISQQLLFIQELVDDGLIVWGQPDFSAPIERTNDPLYLEQFQMNNTGQTIDGTAGQADVDIDAPEAWAITKGSSSITVAVMDDGLEAHPDLPNIIGGLSPVNNGDGSAVAGSNHGVACAGIVAALHNNIGVRGVAPNVQLQSINIFVGGESPSDIADGFYWAIDNDADVISNSWGYTRFFIFAECNINLHPVLTDAINDAATNGRDGKGCVITFASGNNGDDCASYPSNIASVLGVGAVTSSGVRSSYSNYGPRLDIVAPSDGGANDPTVRTTDRVGGAGYSGGDYTNGFGGTSSACPLVSGVGALVLSIDPSLTGPEVHDILINTADDMGANGFDNFYGHGRVNAHQAVQEAQSGFICNDADNDSVCDDVDLCVGVNDLPLNLTTDPPASETQTTITSITSNVSINSGINVTYEAGSFILLSAGFSVASGATFNAVIQGCPPPNSQEIETRQEVIVDELSMTVYPNPMSESVTIDYELIEAQTTQIVLLDLQGRVIRTIQPSERQVAGQYRINWSAPSELSGLYFVYFRTEDEVRVEKLMIVE